MAKLLSVQAEVPSKNYNKPSDAITAHKGDIDPIVKVINAIIPDGTNNPGVMSITSLTTSGNVTVGGSITAKKPVTSGAASTTLTAAQSGGVFLFDATTVEAYILPTAVAGLNYTFVWTATAAGTTDIHTITTASADFLGGSVILGLEVTTPSANAGPKLFTGNGSSHTVFTANGSTTGGVKGGQITVTAISATVWMVTGVVLATGVVATPFS